MSQLKRNNKNQNNLIIVERDFKKISDLSAIKSGLRASQKKILPKFFYDYEGSKLFNKICGTKAYYQTREEIDILKNTASEIGELLGREQVILEPGAGNMMKVRILLDAVMPTGYMGIDVSKQEVTLASKSLASAYPKVHVIGVIGDFNSLSPASLGELMPPHNSKTAFFPGSTIGNFEPKSAVDFLKKLGQTISHGSIALIGIDLKKETEILELAYNDPEGYTKDFNLNILKRINRDYGGDFNLEFFSHHAFYNETEDRIEMHLVSRSNQTVIVSGEEFIFRTDETIHTENSYKYSKDSISVLARKAGFSVDNLYTDDKEYFCLAAMRYNGWLEE